MPRTSKQIQQEQRRVADRDRRQQLATRGPMPSGLNINQQNQWRSWGWFNLQVRAKPTKYAFNETRPNGRVAPPVASPETSDHERQGVNDHGNYLDIF
jgi:hypothetical protein